MTTAIDEVPVHEISAVRYGIVYVVLIALTWLTYGVTRFDLGAANLPVVLGIALGKSALVVFFFMHILHDKGISRLALPVSVFFVALLIAFVLADVGLRFPLSVASEKMQPTHGPLPTWSDDGDGARLPAQ